ncbi:MAG: hypothetical protein HYU97_00540 [Deltaproteobacteria bacterium]|nr:hypothetical protein [Deltaproteobacteria bacterium]
MRFTTPRHPGPEPGSILILFSIFIILTSQLCHAEGGDLKVYSEELASYEAYLKGKDVQARKLIQEVMAKDAKSPVAYLMLGLLTRTDEGNTTRALLYYNKAIEYTEAQCGVTPLTTNCVKWHSIAYQEKIEALTNLDRPQEALDMIAHYDSLYDPKLEVQKIWPLLKLHRHAEATAVAEQVIATDTPENKSIALNALCAIAADLNDRIKSDQVCSEATAQSESMVIYSNTHIAKFAIFDHEGAEQIARKGALYPTDFYGSVWEHLVSQYTLEQRYAEALSAATQAANVHRGFSGLEEELSRGDFLEGVSQLLLALGRMEEAYRFAKESYELPDRTGNTSVTPQFDEFTHEGFYYLMLKLYEEQLAAQMPQLSYREKFKTFFHLLEIRFTRFTVARKLKKLLQVKDHLALIVTPYPSYSGISGTIPFWLVGGLLEVTGSGPFLKAIEQSLSHETGLLDKSEPYYLTLKAQVNFYEHNYSETIRLSEEALAKFPPQEAMLRDLLKTLLAVANGKQGELASQKNLYIEILRSNPLYLRFYQIPIPVHFTTEPGTHTKKALNLLKQSPRLQSNRQGIELHIRSNEHALSLCLQDDYHSAIHCTESEIKVGSKDQSVEKTVSQFIQEAFSPKVDLSQLDVNTLNGAPTKSSGTEAIQDLLKSTH